MLTHPIQVAVRKTGLTAHLLRMWEKRYGAVVPQRTGTQRRMYSEDDIHRLTLLREATQLGHPIGSIATLSDEELRQIVRAEPSVATAKSRARRGVMTIAERIEECVAAVKDFDVSRLNSTLEAATIELGYSGLLHQLIAPLVEQLGELWSHGEITIAHEHCASSAIRGFLFNPARQYAGANERAVLVVATPQGQLHDLGAVMVTALAASHGWRTVYLGASLPAAEIAGAARQNQARAVALSIVYPEDDPNVDRELRDLRRYLPKPLAILVGGRAAKRYRATVRELGATLSGDLLQLQTELAALSAARS
jgi:methanogenic corrinoid protein MtbC1